MSKPMTNDQLLQTLYANTQRAADDVTMAWANQGDRMEKARKVLPWLRRAVAAAQEVENRCAGEKPKELAP